MEIISSEQMETAKIPIQDLLPEGLTLGDNGTITNENKGIFTMKDAPTWIEESKNKPIPKMLFDQFWHEGELCILFADTNQGKSILAVQICDSISKGIPVPGFDLEAFQQKVLYFDFELSAKQFEGRYGIRNKETDRYEQHYSFGDGFKRIEINPKAKIPEDTTFEDYIILSIEKCIKETGAKVLVIDNLTYLKNDLEKSKEAAPLVKGLQALIDKYHCSILILAHTPKRDLSKPVTRNDLQGSKMLINFCDSSFTIGESQKGDSIKYLKQIKVRACEFKYGQENVIECAIEKNSNFLQFRKLDYADELEHLKSREHREHPNTIDNSIILKIKEMDHEGLTQRKIAEELSLSIGAVNKYLKKI